MPSHTESVYCCRFRRLFSHYLRGEIRLADRHRQLFNLRRFNAAAVSQLDSFAQHSA